MKICIFAVKPGASYSELQKMNFKAQKEAKPHFWGIFGRRATSPKPPMTDLITLAGSKMSQNERNYQPRKA